MMMILVSYKYSSVCQRLLNTAWLVENGCDACYKMGRDSETIEIVPIFYIQLAKVSKEQVQNDFSTTDIVRNVLWDIDKILHIYIYI